MRCRSPSRYIPPHRPENPAGHLYYVKLKTKIGPLYKIGFTTFPSVQRRLAFAGNREEDLIDKVLFFEYFSDAADLEIALHQHFSSKALFSKLAPVVTAPLFRNGQAEIYAEDVLQLDRAFCRNSAEEAIKQSKIHKYARSIDASPKEAETLMQKQERKEQFFRSVMMTILYPIFWPIGRVLRLLKITEPTAAEVKSLPRPDLASERYFETILQRLYRTPSGIRCRNGAVDRQ